LLPALSYDLAGYVQESTKKDARRIPDIRGRDVGPGSKKQMIMPTQKVPLAASPTRKEPTRVNT